MDGWSRAEHGWVSSASTSVRHSCLGAIACSFDFASSQDDVIAGVGITLRAPGVEFDLAACGAAPPGYVFDFGEKFVLIDAECFVFEMKCVWQSAIRTGSNVHLLFHERDCFVRKWEWIRRRTYSSGLMFKA
jgi:hypothetical protein